jgi:pyruvate dehydrogenase E1 component alpha subunit
MSAQVRGTDQVALCFFGDGAVNQGTFHESLNMASVWKLPVIYLCENNGYAITTSLERSHGQPSIARRADGYGLPGLAVDGQVLDAVYAATAAAVVRARAGEGPTLIEAKTFRFDEHQVGIGNLIHKPYRPEGEAEKQRTRDPILLFRAVLQDRGISEEELRAIEAEVETAVAEAIHFAEESPFPHPSSLFDYMFSTPLSVMERYHG